MRPQATTSRRAFRHLWVTYAGISALIGVVLVLAWMQFRWLTQLSQEEEERRRVALRVAASNYAEYVARELTILLDKIDAAGSIRAVAADEPLLHTVFLFDEEGSVRLSRDTRPEWSPAGRAEIQQQLGRPLIDALSVGARPSNATLWLAPPAVLHCPDACQVAVLPNDVLAARILAPGAERMFADFGSELRLAVVSAGTATQDVLYPAETRAADFAVTDLTQNLLNEVPMLGPDNSHWQLQVNHGGSSLETAVARSHARNVILSAGLLTLLLLSMGLVLFNARRQAALAREHLYFVAGVSHELRTPLSVISSAASNLADRTVDDQASVREHGLLIQQEVRRLQTMIENILQFTQSASVQQPRSRQVIDVRALLDKAIQKCQALLGERELRLEVADDLPAVRGDAGALESALANLIANAAQYGAGENWVRIRLAPVRVRPRGRALRISVSNPVRGSPDPHPERLFEPFYRGQNVRTSEIPGTGIGLAVARNVARQHGGGLTVDTEKSGIVTFNLILPIDESSGAAHTPG